MYFTKTPYIFTKLLPSILWKSREKKTVHLTFDDGPTEKVTSFILDILKKHNVKASFFCIGTKAKSLPKLIERIKKEGHTIGNHTNDHQDGWKTKTDEYIDSINEANKIIQSNLFRPPYGRLTPKQYQTIRDRYKIVMWDIMPGDFDDNKSAKECYETILDNLEDGSIIVLHDNEKAYKKISYILPKLLEQLHSDGWEIKPL